jgi:transcriptional regulator of acetoin/glycerol metabolism
LRELRNVLDHARAVCADAYIDVPDLPDILAGPAPSAVLPQPGSAQSPTAAPFDPHQLPPEGMLLMQYLRASGWNLSAVARQIGVSRMTLYRRMERYGIQSPNRRDGGPEPTDA